MEKKMVIVMTMILLIISANLDGVRSGPFDCYDACPMDCISLDIRFMARCKRKCDIKCGPEPEANGHFK